MLVTLPFVLLLLDYWPLQRCSFPACKSAPETHSPVAGIPSVSWRRLVLEKIPFLALSALSCVVTMIAQKRGEAGRSLDAYPLVSRIGNALIS